MKHMSHDEYIARQREKVAGIAADALGVRISMIEAARRISALSDELEIDEYDEDMMKFVLIDSETHALPIGHVRRHWSPDALAKLDSDIARAEAWARETGAIACQNLIERFSQNTEV